MSDMCTDSHMSTYSGFEENMKKKAELEKEYEEFIKTEKGKKWVKGWKYDMQSDIVGDFGDYLYDFYPEILQQ